MAKRTGRVRVAAAVNVPQTQAEVNNAITQIGIAQREIARITADMNDSLAASRTAWESQAEPHKLLIKDLAGRVQLYCEAHRDALTEHGKTKTAKFLAGEVSWRKRPPSVHVRSAKIVLAALKFLGLDRFIRTTEEINKEAVLAEPDAVKKVVGLSVVKDVEDFIVKPWDTELEQVV